MMRYPVVGWVVLGLGCGAGESTKAERAANNANEACSTASASRFFWDATQVTYDFQPQSGESLAAAATAVVRGHLSALRLAPPRPTPDDEAVLVELTIDRAYKGTLAVDAKVVVRLAKAGSVDTARVLSAALPTDEVTLFLAELAAGDASYGLASPQGLLVSSDCGVEQPLTELPLFPAEVDSSAELDAALQHALVGSP
jgi:hypothetical protein